MAPEEKPTARASIRFTATGDVEVFDGKTWRLMNSMATDPNLGSRDDRLAPGAFETDQAPESAESSESSECSD